MIKHYDLFGVGAALLDVECHVDDALLAGLGLTKSQMVLASHEEQQQLIDRLEVYSETCGGSVANAVITASHFGATTHFACRVSDDEAGWIFLRGLEHASVSYGARDQTRGVLPTGRCLVLLTADAERTMQTVLGANREIAPDDVDAAALAASRYVYIEGYLVDSECGLETALHTRKLAVASDTAIVLSLSDVSIVRDHRDGLSQLFGDEGVDLLFCNRAEALAWTGADTLAQALPELGALARCVAVTTDADGAELWHEGAAIHIDPHPIVVIDTNGAGDAFAGVFLYGLISGYGLRHAGSFANYVASGLVSRHGSRLTPELCQELRQSFPRPEAPRKTQSS